MTSIIPARILRAHAIAHDDTLEEFTQRERRQRERILHHAPGMFRRYGRLPITLANFACALKLSAAAVKKHFCDLDALLAYLLTNHLLEIAQAIGEIPGDAPDHARAARAAYLAAARSPIHGLTELHYLLVHERQNLPPDLLAQVDEQHHRIAVMCAGGHDLAAKVISLLDNPSFDPAEIEAALAAGRTLAAQPAFAAERPQAADGAAPIRPSPIVMDRGAASHFVPKFPFFPEGKSFAGLARPGGVTDPLAGITLTPMPAPIPYPQHQPHQHAALA